MPKFRMEATGNGLVQLHLDNLSAPFWTKEDARSAMANALQRVAFQARTNRGMAAGEIGAMSGEERWGIADEISSYLAEFGDFYGDGEYADVFESAEVDIQVRVTSVGGIA